VSYASAFPEFEAGPWLLHRKTYLVIWVSVNQSDADCLFPPRNFDTMQIPGDVIRSL
jgi:hypothetical protein